MAEKRTVAEAHARLDTHEAECTLRYEALAEKIGDVKTDAEGIKRGQRAMIGALCVWLALQLWGYVQRDIAAAKAHPEPAAQVASK